MKQTFKFLTLSRVLNDCRDSVGRLSTLLLLLFALSFGFNQEVKADNGIKGSWDNYEWHNINSNSYTVWLNATTDYWFGIDYGGTWKDCGSCGAITRDNSQDDHKLYSNGGGHQKIYCDKYGPYVFNMTHDDGPHIKVTYPDGAFHEIYAKRTVNGVATSEVVSKDLDLGDVTSFVLNDVYLKCWDNFGQNNTAWNSGASLFYRYNSTNHEVASTTIQYKSSGSNNYEFQKTGANVDFVKLVSGNSSTKKNSGKYTIEVWGKVKATDPGWGEAYLKNGNNNFVWSFTIQPPAVSNFGYSAIGAISGDGTQNNPYLVQYGNTLTLTATGSQATTDDNSSLYASWANGTYTTSAKEITVNASGSITVKGKYYKYNDDLSGAETSEKTIYYQAVYTGLQIADAGCSMTAASSLNENQVVQGQSVTITKGTPATGYEFKDVTVTSGGTINNLTWTPSANNQTATVNWKETMHTATIAYMCESSSIKTATTSGQAGIATTTAITAPEITGYTFSSWATLPSGASTSNQLSSTTINVNLTADNLTITANYERNATFDLVVKAGAHVTTVTGGVTGEASVPFTKQISATAFDNGYEFDEWTAIPAENAEFASSTSATTNVTVKNGSVDVTANAKPTTYTITYNGLEDGTHSNPDFYTIETATITLTNASRDNYTFDGWFGNENLTGNPITSIPQGTTGDKVYWAKWHETLHAVTINKGTGITSVDPIGEQQVGNVNPLNISAIVATGYTWSQWTSTGGVTIDNASSVSTTIKATGDGTVTATATEILLPLTTSANESHMGSVDKTASSIGVATTSQLTATATNRNYKFKQWNLTNCTITSGTVNDATIIIKGDGINTPSAEAEFEVAWYVNGDDVFSGWGTNGHQMTEQSEGVFTVTINVTKIASANIDFGCKIYNASQGWYYEYNNTEGDGWWFTRENPSTTIGHNDKTNMRLRSDMVGDYTFTLDCSTSRDNPTLTVSFPGESSRTVTVETEAGSKEVEVSEATQTALVADQYVNGLRFDRWVVTNSAGEDKSSSITINTPTSYSTHMKNATEDGLIVKATYTSHGMIYFKNNANWSGVNVYFYKGDYYDGTNGTGCVAKGKDDKGQEWSDRKATGYGMTNLKNTDIWYYNWIDNISPNPNTAYVAFSDKLQNDNQWFYQCQVAYRGDWHDEAPLFVIREWIHSHHNQTAYYEEGLWMKYNSTESGYDIRGNWGTSTWAKLDAQSFKATSAGGYEFFTELIQLPVEEKEFKVYFDPKTEGAAYNTFGTAEGKGNKISSATPYTKVYENTGNAYIQPTAAAGYIFKLSLGDGQIIVSVEYPLSPGDYQVVSVTEGKVHSNGIIYKQGAEASLASFFIEKEKTTELKLQKCSTIVDNKPVWENTSVTYDIPSTMETGIYNFSINPDATNPTIENLNQAYSGKYYIRTSGVDGGWESFSTNKDNEMTDYGSLLDAGITYNNFKYNYYKTKWIHKDANVKFTIANDYSKCISDSLESDNILDAAKNEKQTLPQDANIRFMWNSKNNTLSRAYISGSTNISDRFLVLEGDSKMFDSQGRILTAVPEAPLPEGKTAADYAKVTGLNDYELNFADKNNWVYQADIKAQPGCAVKLTAAYNGNIQYFIGAAGEEATSRKTIIDGTKASDTKYTMRVVYDFKTNRLVAGWVPSNTEITEDITLGGDMLISRTHQDDAQQITFGDNGSIEDIHHIYGVLTIEKGQMIGTKEMSYSDKATNADYAKTMYWISFPFNVKISEIFGVDGYGQKWIMQKYRGDLRAQKGWFKGDGTETFWEFMEKSDSLNAYEGYLFLIDANYFNTADADVWKNSATEANFYFPSASGDIGIINKSSYPQYVQPHECKIDREFEVTDSKGNKTTVNHKNTDSHWNVIGVPAFQNKTMALGTETETDMKAIYQWNSTNNTYDVKALSTNFEFKTMYAYMVQYTGTINWSDVSVVNNPTEAQGGTAPKYAYADEKNYMVELFFNGNDAEDHTYINLADEASTDFVLNEDMMKIDNAGFPNIYSFAGNYNVAYNETKMTNQTVTIGVSAPKDGNYTFAMPKDFSGTAKLVDLVEGITTDLNISNYSVDLNKGSYNNRFQLVLEVEAKTPTSMEADGQKGREADGKTTKILRNGEIYLINGGRVYNVLGVEE